MPSRGISNSSANTGRFDLLCKRQRYAAFWFLLFRFFRRFIGRKHFAGYYAERKYNIVYRK